MIAKVKYSEITIWWVGDEITVVIGDRKMPVMSGAECMGMAKQKYDHIYYLILTGYGHNAEIERAMLQTKLIKTIVQAIPSAGN